LTSVSAVGAGEDIDAILDEEQTRIKANRPTHCFTCRDIIAEPKVGDYIEKGLDRGMTQRQIIDVVQRRCGISMSPDSFAHHVRSQHGR
jgi:hypothetical protein